MASTVGIAFELARTGAGIFGSTPGKNRTTIMRNAARLKGLLKSMRLILSCPQPRHAERYESVQRHSVRIT